MNAKETLEKVLTAAVGASLAINAYLIKDKVGEMTESVKQLNANVANLMVETAVVKQQVGTNTVRIDKNSDEIMSLKVRDRNGH